MKNLDTTTLVAYLFALCIAVAACYFLFRWIFAIKRQLWNQKQQIALLIKIAKKLGVSQDEVELIEKKNNTSEI